MVHGGVETLESGNELPVRLRVLLVDDSSDHSDLLVREIRQNGHDVTCQRVDTAERLREALENTGWDLVIGDDRVSGFSALDAVAILKSMRLDIPFILVSGTLDDDLELKAFQAGVDDYLMKDNLHRLMPAIRRALREAEERRVRCMAEQALRESEERYRELVENANDVILSTDLEGNFIALNTAGELLSGYSREELRHMNMAQVLTPESLSRAKEMIGQKLLDGRPTTYELDMIARDGHVVPLELSTRLICQDGKPVALQGVARDITDRRRIEAELRIRARQQAVVAELGQRALAGLDLQATLQDAVTTVAETLGVEFCMVSQLLPDGKALLGVAGTGWRPGTVGKTTIPAGPESQAGYTLLASEPVVVEDLVVERRFNPPLVLVEHGIHSGLSVIIHGPGHPFGTLSAFASEPRGFSQDDVHFLQAVANVLATAIERKRLEDERTRHSMELATTVLQAQEEERKRIARELHDETAQALSTLLVTLDVLEPHIPADATFLQDGFARVRSLARRTLDETRALSHDLRPTILDDVGLISALQWFAAEYERTYGCRVEVQAQPEAEQRPAPEVELVLFRTAQEALTNCGKHAEAERVSVWLSFDGGTARLVVEDNGKGFDPAQVPGPSREGRLGLYGMHERVALLGGKLSIETAPGRGTRIIAAIPLTSGVPARTSALTPENQGGV